MRKPVVENTIYGLKCDAKGCGYRDMSVTRDQYPEMVGAPCPECGASLLTQADMDMVLKIERLTRRVNFWLGWTKYLFRGRHTVVSRLELDGTGKCAATIEALTSEPNHDHH